MSNSGNERNKKKTDILDKDLHLTKGVDESLRKKLNRVLQAEHAEFADLESELQIKAKSPERQNTPFPNPFPVSTSKTSSLSSADDSLFYIDDNGKKQTFPKQNDLIKGFEVPVKNGVPYILKKNNDEFEASLSEIPKAQVQLCHTIMRMIDDIVANTGACKLEIDTKYPVAQAICYRYIEALGLRCNLNPPEENLDRALSNLISKRADLIQATEWFKKIKPGQNMLSQRI